MELPTQPVTLSIEQIQELSQHFSYFRHDVNNCVGLIGAAAELVRYSPASSKKWCATLIDQPPRIAGKTREFVREAEKLLSIRDAAEPAWYRDLWSRSNGTPSEPASAVSVPPAGVKALHAELLQLHKEVSLLAFTNSGAQALVPEHPGGAAEVMESGMEQLGKVTRKFDQFAALFEKTFGVTSVPHRLLTGLPTAAVTLSPDEVALFHRRLTNLQHDIYEHLGPLLELSRVARTAPEELAARAPELAPRGPKIADALMKFGNDFDKTFGLNRGG
jgi:hypothetical protein